MASVFDYAFNKFVREIAKADLLRSWQQWNCKRQALTRRH